VILGATFAVPATRRTASRTRGAPRRDRARLVLELAVKGLPPDRNEWAQAMLAELDEVEGTQDRRRFSLGCAWAAARIRVQSPGPAGGVFRAVIMGCAAAAIALVGYGLVRYPGLRSEPNVAGAMIAFLAMLLVYVALAVVLARGATRHSLVGGLAVGAGWFTGLAPPSGLKEYVFAPLLVALAAPAVVAFVAGRRAQGFGPGTVAALWSGLVGGLAVFVVWMTVTYATAGVPYDAGLVRDFHRSGGHDLATYAVSDDLGNALVLLLLIPTVAVALGSLTARVHSAMRST
jgi:hypothetical protein